MKLINKDDPPPAIILNSDGKAPILLVCDHASPAIPRALGNIGLNGGELKLHVAWDIGAAVVTRMLSEKLNAVAVLAGYSRLLIDLNRQPGDLGSILEKTDSIVIPGNLKLGEEQQNARVKSFFWPYHQSISKTLAQLWRRGPVPALFSVHSFTPTLNGNKRRWDIGVLWNRDPRLALPLIKKLKELENGRFCIGDNKPYSGRELGYTIDIHAGITGLPNCAIEIRQDLIDTTDGARYWANTLTDILNEILADDRLHSIKRY